MRYYVTRWAGTGSDEDPYRVPDAAGVIDLRPDATKPDGWALAAFPDGAAPTGGDVTGVDLGDDPAARLPALTRRRLENALAVATLDNVALRRIITTLLVAHGDDASPSRWNRLRAMRDGRYRVFLAGLLDELPVPSGGATIAETWNGRPDGAGLDWDLDWDGTLALRYETQSGQARLDASNLNGSGYRNAIPLDTNQVITLDHHAQVAINALPASGAGGNVTGATVRTAAGGANYYDAELVNSDGIVSFRLFKTVSNTRTSLASGIAHIFNVGDTVRCEANGSTIRGLLNGVQQASVTDTTLPEPARVGMFIRNRSSGVVLVDSFFASDLAETGGPVALAGTSASATAAPAATLTVTGPAGGPVDLAGTAAASSGTPPAAADVTRPLAGTSAASAAVPAAPLDVTWHLDATAPASSSATAPLAVARPAAGTAAAASAGAADLTADRALAGTTPATSDATGSLTVETAGITALAGTAAATTAPAASLTVARTLTATTPATTSSSTALTVGRSLAGETAATTTTAGALDVARTVGLAGTAAATSATTSTLTVADVTALLPFGELSAALLDARAVRGSLLDGQAVRGTVLTAPRLTGTVLGVAP